ncbi:M23 family metallopeptidase [Patescibacteria group bacterium]|nr:M23 family metallopeptidase [Patescibacteria group bacterium]
MKNLKPLYIIILLLIISAFLIWQYGLSSEPQIDNQIIQEEPIVQDRIVEIKIEPNSTYGQLMKEAGAEPVVYAAIFNAAKDVYNLTSIRAERSLFLYFDGETDEFKRLVYQIDSEEELFVVYRESCRPEAGQPLADIVYRNATSTDQIEDQGCWEAERLPIVYEIKEVTQEGELETSLYQWALDNEVDVRAILDLADAYQWTIDFAIDPKAGDTFKFIYEERYRDGEYIMPGKILAAKYINEGAEYQIYYFEETDENKGHFDENGVSVQKDLLKAPINYKYITSGFTTGLRCLSYFSLCTNHRAIDYAAAAGTPIRSVGDGTVVFAGWNSGGYGYLTTIRHNDTYSTNYAHQSKILVSYGQKVKQGDIIGKVGSTGLSTGPHLHYEILKHGTKINPLTLELPPGEPIKEENKERFFQEIEKYQDMLNQ